MERFARLAQLWTWLPAFRAVAEAEHLPTAARAMGLTPSALSRAVTQLERAVERPLFDRVGRRIQLAPAGRDLLTAVRDAMRRIDDSLATLASERPTRVRIAGDGLWIALVVAPALAAGLELDHVELAAAQVRDALLRGVIDLAIAEIATPSDDVVIERLGTVAQHVCSASDDRASAFATCSTRADVWPSELSRIVALRSPHLDAVIEACSGGSMRAVLPTVIARARGLRIHSTPMVPDSQLYLLRRIPLGTSAIEGFVPAIRERAKAVLGAATSGRRATPPSTSR